MKLYDNEISSAASRVRIALALKGVSVERSRVEILGAEADNRGADYLRVNPQGLVPALLTDEGELLTQSLAIIEYLDELYPYPPLLPQAPAARAHARALALAVGAETHPLLTPRVAAHLQAIPGAAADTVTGWKRHWLTEGLDALEALIARRRTGWLCIGDVPTLADIFLFPQAVNAERAGLPLAQWPNIAEIVANLRTIPDFADNAPGLNQVK
jgi:maleylpyruvate isomerase